MSSGIYEIRNMLNGHRYIGSAKNLKARKSAHFSDLNRNAHHCYHMQFAYNAYGKENFVFTVLYECQPEELIRCEQEEIDLLKPEYNICKVVGNCKGVKATDEAKKNMSIARKGRKLSEETKQKIGDAQRGEKSHWWGRSPSEEIRKKISEINTGMVFTEEHKQRISAANKGRRNSDEAIQKMANTKRGKKLTDEHKKNIGLGVLGIKRSDETKLKMSIAQKNRYEKERAERNYANGL